jgi:CRP/FNR family cyclic AMP-dependent transcriptional regulator
VVGFNHRRADSLQMSDDFDFTKPQPAQPPEPLAGSAGFKPANSQYYNAEVARAFFQAASGREERFEAGQQLFVEAEKAVKGGLFSGKSASRMYFIAEGEVALTIGGKALDTIVGEMAVISERPRSATATAKVPLRAYSLNAAELQSALAKTPEFALMLMSVMFDRLRFIAARLATRKSATPAGVRESSVFDPVLLQQFEKALARAQIMRYQAGASIMREGQAGIYMYVVKSGQVVIAIRDKVVEVVNPGGTFGEMALVDQSPRVANATAHIYSELLTVDRASLLEAVKAQPAFAMAMLRAVTERLRHMNSQLG